MKESEYVVLTPVYKKDDYQYHECSCCKSKIYMQESYFTPFCFDEIIKYCPFCGNQVIRYGNPIFEEEIDWSWLKEYKYLFHEFSNYLEYIIHCKMSYIERQELINNTKLGAEYFKNTDTDFLSNENICKYLHRLATCDLHHSTKKKLERRFKNIKYEVEDEESNFK